MAMGVVEGAPKVMMLCISSLLGSMPLVVEMYPCALAALTHDMIKSGKERKGIYIISSQNLKEEDVALDRAR